MPKRKQIGKAFAAAAITAAVLAAVFCTVLIIRNIIPYIMPPGFSAPSSRTVYDPEDDIKVVEEGRRISVFKSGHVIWELDREILAQDFLFEDIDHDSKKELIILCWKRGRFGKHKPTWVKSDEKSFSQHIFIYEIERDSIRPKWMASDIGMDAASFKWDDGVLVITDTDGAVTKWKWISWGLEKL